MTYDCVVAPALAFIKTNQNDVAEVNLPQSYFQIKCLNLLVQNCIFCNSFKQGCLFQRMLKKKGKGKKKRRQKISELALTCCWIITSKHAGTLVNLKFA